MLKVYRKQFGLSRCFDRKSSILPNVLLTIQIKILLLSLTFRPVFGWITLIHKTFRKCILTAKFLFWLLRFGFLLGRGIF